MCFQDIGSHILKSKTFLETVQVAKYHNFRDFQIFSGNTKGYYRKTPDEKDVQQTKQFLLENKMNMYIHSVYLINLGRPSFQIEKALECLKWELTWGPKLGAKGIVVHVGKYLKGTEEEALENTKNNIKLLIDTIDPTCPLLIETPAGQGTETLTLLEDFKKFIIEIQKESEASEVNKPKIGCCVDTCHIFASGYNPMWYLEELSKDVKVNLVHYNDSQTEQGSRKDRHAPPGMGHIGPEEMLLVREWCLKNSIPMVIE